MLASSQTTAGCWAPAPRRCGGRQQGTELGVCTVAQRWTQLARPANPTDQLMLAFLVVAAVVLVHTPGNGKLLVGAEPIITK